MKIGIITYSRARNYGGILQAYALYAYLKSCGYDVEFIDYIPPAGNVLDKRLFIDKQAKTSNSWGKFRLTRWLWGQLVYPALLKDYLVFFKFMENRVSFSSRYVSYENLMQSPPQADVFISGSDQIWNEHFTPTGFPDLAYLLGFAQNSKRISYASSFGKSNISEKSSALIAPYLKQYSHISVRENSGKRILNDLGVNASVVLDPTMLCSADIWERLALFPVSTDNYVFLYLIRFDKRLYELAQAIAHRRNKKLIAVTLNRMDLYTKYKGKGKAIAAAKIEHWLSYIRYADAVVTDSFHALVFSLLFHKDFIVNTATRKNMAGRITELLSLIELKELEMSDFDVNNALECLAYHKDWNRIDTIIESERIKSRQWLKHAINE